MKKHLNSKVCKKNAINAHCLPTHDLIEETFPEDDEDDSVNYYSKYIHEFLDIMESRSTVPVERDYLQFKDDKYVHHWWRKMMRRNDLLRLKPYSLLFTNRVVGDEIRRFNKDNKYNKKRKINNVYENDPIREFLKIKFD